MWVMSDDNKIINTENEVWIDTFMSAPYPANIWRIDALHNDGNPYHLLLPGIVSLNLYAQKQKKLIHVYSSTAKTSVDFEKNGYAIIQPISCTVRQEKNGMYEAELECNIDAEGKFKYLSCNSILKIPIRYHDVTSQQLFRIYNAVRKMGSSGEYRIVVNARHIFYDLNDKLLLDCRPSGKNGADALNWIIGNIYGGTSSNDIVFSHQSDINTISTAYYEKQSVTAALLGADNAFTSRWGGSLYRDNFYFSLNKSMEYSRATGTIRYGYNMIDIEFTADYSETVTYLIAEDNFGNRKNIINSAVPCSEFPHHVYKYISISYDTEDKAQFEADAQAYFDNYKQANVNIKVNFADLSDLELYSDFLQLADYEVGDKVIVYHKDLDINYSNLEIISKTYDVVNQQTAEIEIGSFKDAIVRSSFMSNSVSTSQGAIDKQVAAMQSELRDVKLKNFKSWESAKSSTFKEISEYTWKEVLNIVN